MRDKSDTRFLEALQHFRLARFHADLQRVWGRLSGKSVDLLAYEEVRQKLHATTTAKRTLKEIPLKAIVGSVGRYKDFTRSFLPLNEGDRSRWAAVELKASSPEGLPPIEVYQIGDVYFVIDGNHRVSVARQTEAEFIEAYVTELQTRVPLSPDVQPDDLILKEQLVNFLETTQLDRLCPRADYRMTVPGNYRVLVEQIEIHRYVMSQAQQRDVSMQEAAADWCEQIYMPVVKVIRARGMLRDFPKRTETDLYVWIAKHIEELKAQWGWRVEPETAIADLVEQFSRSPKQVVVRVGEKILESVVPSLLDTGPPPGQWRHEKQRVEPEQYLFSKILVSVNGYGAGWQTLDQALLVAQRERARVKGLHFVEKPKQSGDGESQAVEAEFKRQCAAKNIAGEFFFETGNIAKVLSKRARWANLVVIHSGYALEPSLVNRLSANLEVLLRRCPRPILAVSQTASPLDSVLLAYDGSAKAKEALFVAAYLAGQWQTPLAVLGVVEETPESTQAALQRARAYLESQRVEAIYVQKNGPVAEAILQTAREQGSNLIVMGGYGHTPLVEVVLGSTVDEVLRTSQWPVLVCR